MITDMSQWFSAKFNTFLVCTCRYRYCYYNSWITCLEALRKCLLQIWFRTIGICMQYNRSKNSSVTKHFASNLSKHLISFIINSSRSLYHSYSDLRNLLMYYVPYRVLFWYVPCTLIFTRIIPLRIMHIAYRMHGYVSSSTFSSNSLHVQKIQFAFSVNIIEMIQCGC